jgi:hypothetical protein
MAMRPVLAQRNGARQSAAGFILHGLAGARAKDSRRSAPKAQKDRELNVGSIWAGPA